MRPVTTVTLIAAFLSIGAALGQDTSGLPPLLTNESEVFSNDEGQDASLYDPGIAGGYFAQFDVMFLNLSGNGGHYAPFLDHEFDEPFIAVSSMSNHNFMPVPKVTMGYLAADGAGWEFIYFGFGISSWQRTAVHVGDDETQTSRTGAWIHNGELNFISARTENGFSCLAGIRTFHFQEHLFMEEDEWGYFSNHQVYNHLYGGQIGFRYFHQHDRWTLQADVKVGIFGNDVSGKATFNQFMDDESLVTFSQGSHTSQIAYMEEVSFYATYQLTDSIYLRGGYHIFAVQGIARASGQFDAFGPLAGVNTSGHAVLHGPSAGIEIRF